MALSEYQRRKHQISRMSDRESSIFLTLIWKCLENDEKLRPISAELVEDMLKVSSKLSGELTAVHQFKQCVLQIEQLQCEKAKAQDRIKHLNSTVQECTSQYEALHSRYKESEQKVIQLETDLVKLITQFCKDNGELQGRLNSYQEEIAQLDLKNQQMQQEINALTLHNSNQAKLKSQLVQEKTLLQQQNQEFTSINVHLRAECEQLKGDKVLLVNENFKLKSHNNELSKKALLKQRLQSRLKSKIQTLLQMHEEEISHLHSPDLAIEYDQDLPVSIP